MTAKTKKPSIAKRMWGHIGPRYLPFADAATADLPLGRLLRLALFQISVGMAVVLLTGTLNRVMIVELGVPTFLVALMVSLPLVFAPLRALIGFRSDTHRSFLGWRRVPYIWFGSILQFGGLAIMPFALLVLSGNTLYPQPPIYGQLGAAAAFLMTGAGLHMTQTAGLALACDMATEKTRHRVVALLYVMFLVGMVVSALAFGWLLADFDQIKLIQIIQSAAVLTIVLNVIALWKQEARQPHLTRPGTPRPTFAEAWARLAEGGLSTRLLVAIALGTAGFSMQDILLEPYGGEVLGLSVAQTTALTALLAGGSLIGFAVAARRLSAGENPNRLAAWGVLVGICAFSCVIFADPLNSATVFRVGTVLIGLGGGLFAVATLTAIMAVGSDARENGTALGVWGAVQATAAGTAIAMGGILRDGFEQLASAGLLGEALNHPAASYGFVYHIEILFLFGTLVAIGPLARAARPEHPTPPRSFGLAEFPG